MLPQQPPPPPRRPPPPCWAPLPVSLCSPPLTLDPQRKQELLQEIRMYYFILLPHSRWSKQQQEPNPNWPLESTTKASLFHLKLP